MRGLRPDPITLDPGAPRHRLRSSTRRGAVAAAVALGAATVLPGMAGAGERPPVSAGTDALGGEVAAQVAAIQADKASRTPTEEKVDSNLLYAAREATGRDAVEGVPDLASSVAEDRSGRVLVDVDATVDDALLMRIGELHGKVIAAVPGFDAVRANLPVEAVLALAGDARVASIRPADGAEPDAGAATDEADVTQGVADARATYGVDGTGQKVCVMSDGVDSLADRRASGDLPAVDVLSGQAGSGDEGTAMLELVHDLAPGAELGYATAITSLAQFAQNINGLRADGCNVIVDDISYYTERTFQDSIVSQAITQAKAAGVMYLSSAGNSGNLADGTAGSWQGDFADGGAPAAPLPTTGYRLHSWAAGVTQNVISTGSTGRPVFLEWADPSGASANDYDLYVLNPTGTSVLGSSTNVQSGSQDPVESVGGPGLDVNAFGNRVVVLKATAAASRYLVLHTNRGELVEATGGSARAHNNSADAISTAATPARTPSGSGPTGPWPGQHSSGDLSETFSSDGPVRQYFTSSGAAITPGNFSSTGGTSRRGPDLTAADGVATTTPGYTTFFGTSAAAPNAAAIAALARQARPTFTPAQIESAMKGASIDIEGAGADTVTGSGIVMAPALLGGIGTGDTAPVAEPDSYLALRDTTLTKAAPGLLANDSNGGALTATKVTDPSHGTVELNSDGSFVYTPTAGYLGPDSFTYRVNDGIIESAADATVSLTVVTPTEAYVRQVYQDFLGRPTDRSGLAFWTGRLDSGRETRSSFVRQMTRSSEYARKVVTRAYQDVLGRTPDPSGLAYWSGRVQGGLPVASLVLELTGSNEFLTKSGGTVDGFVNAAYQAILARQPTAAERSAKVNAINAGTTRRRVALDLYNTTESKRRRTAVQFKLLLQRDPTTAEYDTWVTNLTTQSDVTLAIFLAASNEYYDNSLVL